MAISQVYSCFISTFFCHENIENEKPNQNILEVSIICWFLCKQFIFVDYYPE